MDSFCVAIQIDMSVPLICCRQNLFMKHPIEDYKKNAKTNVFTLLCNLTPEQNK